MAKDIRNNIIDLDFSATKRKQFRINGDDDRIIELNTSDMGIITRVSEAIPVLDELQLRASKLMDGIEDDSEDVYADMATISERLKAIDKEMRELVDTIFDYPVSAVIAPDGSMYDPFNGTLRYELIITTLISQYEKNLQSEFNKMSKQLDSHTAKYTKKGK